MHFIDQQYTVRAYSSNGVIVYGGYDHLFTIGAIRVG